MKYTPNPDRSQKLIDPDDFQADLPEPIPPKAKRAKGPSPFNPKANNAIQNLFIWLILGVLGYWFFTLTGGWIESSSSPEWSAALAAAGGLGLGSTLIVRAKVSDDFAPFYNVHLFFIISLGLALIDTLPQSLVFSVIGPLLVGFGFGTFIGAVLSGPAISSIMDTSDESDAQLDKEDPPIKD